MKEFRSAAALGVACASLWAWPFASAPAQTSTARAVVTRSEQAARDNDRLRILHEELAREQGQAADAAQRRAERLAAGDPRGAEEAEQAQRRAVDNISALRREISGAVQPESYAAPDKPAAVPPTRAVRRAAPMPAYDDTTGAPWWDVYARTTGGTEFLMTPRAASVLLRPTPAAATARAPQPQH